MDGPKIVAGDPGGANGGFEVMSVGFVVVGQRRMAPLR